MITRVRVSGFRGIRNWFVDFGQEDRCVWLQMGEGTGKSSLISALSTIKGIAIGQVVLGEWLGIPHELRSMSGLQCELGVTITCSGHEYAYEVCIEDDVNLQRRRVSKEVFTVDRERLFERADGVVKWSQSNDYSVDDRSFVLSNFMTIDLGHPVAVFRSLINKSMFLSPLPQQMGDDVLPGPAAADDRMLGFASWVAGLFQWQPELYHGVMDGIRQVCPRIRELVIRSDDIGGGHLHLLMQGSCREVPFSAAATTEKMAILLASIGELNRLSDNLVCFCEDPFVYFSEKSRTCGLRLLVDSFHSKGQFVVLSSAESGIESGMKFLHVENDLREMHDQVSIH